MDDETRKRLNRTDLNLLTALHALLSTQSTTAAAARLGRTQSATSHSLNRLRALFGDPLLVRHGPRLQVTPFGRQLLAPLERLLATADELVSKGGSFDPLTSTRDIVLAGPDICIAPLLDMAMDLRRSGPDLRIRIDGSGETRQKLMEGTVDLAFELYPGPAGQGIVQHGVKPLRWATFVRQGHRLVDNPDLEGWLCCDHVQVATGPGRRSPVNDTLAALGHSRRIGLQVGHFLQALQVAAASDLAFTTLADLAHEPALRLGLATVPVPFDLVSVPAAICHRDSRFDPVAAWLEAELASHWA